MLLIDRHYRSEISAEKSLLHRSVYSRPISPIDKIVYLLIDFIYNNFNSKKIHSLCLCGIKAWWKQLGTELSIKYLKCKKPRVSKTSLCWIAVWCLMESYKIKIFLTLLFLIAYALLDSAALNWETAMFLWQMSNVTIC